MSSKRWLNFISLVLAVALMLWAWRDVNWSHLSQILQRIHPGWIGLATVTFLAAFVVRGHRWGLLLELGSMAPDDDTTAFIFQQGLDYPIRRHLLLATSPPTLLADMEEMAERAEAAEAQAKSTWRPATWMPRGQGQRGQRKNPGEGPMDLDWMQ